MINKEKNKILITSLVLLTGVAGMIATDIYAPALPVITKDLNSTSALLKLTLTMYFLGISLSPLCFGAWSDRYGRKPLLLFFGILGLSGTVLAGFATNVDTLIFARVIQGIGFGITTALARVVIVDLFEGNELVKVASYVSFFTAIAPAVAPILGSYLLHTFGWRSIFYILSAYLLVGLTLIAVLLPETIKKKDPNATNYKTILKNYRTLLSSRNFITYVICTSVTFAGSIIFFSLSPFILQGTYHLNILQYGWFIGLITFMVIVSRILNLPLLKFFNSDQIITVGLTTMLLACGTLFIATVFITPPLLLILICMMLFILGGGIIYPNCTASALSNFRHMGGISGALYASLQTFGAFFAGIIASYLPNTILVLTSSLLVLTSIGLIAMLSHYAASKVKPSANNLLRS